MPKEASSEKANKTIKEKMIRGLKFIWFLIAIFFIFGGVLSLSAYVILHFRNDQEKIMTVELPGDRYVGLRIIECRYPLGSIFNKDEIVIGSNGFVITKRSIWGSDIKTIPYSKIKQIEFAEGMYWNSFTVKREGFWRNQDTIYFKENLTKDTIKSLVTSIAPEMVVIEKQETSYRIGEYLGLNQPTGEERPYKKKRGPQKKQESDLDRYWKK